MNGANNSLWSEFARVRASQPVLSYKRPETRRAVALVPLSRKTLQTSLKRLATANDRLRAALERQRQLSAKLQLIIDGATADAGQSDNDQEHADIRAATLTPRQHQIMALVLVGHPSKNIAADLQLSQRTVENHRAAIMKKMGTPTLADLVRAGLEIENKVYRYS